MDLWRGGKYDASIPVLIAFAIRTMESAVYTICANQILYVLHQEKFLVRVLLGCGLLNAGAGYPIGCRGWIHAADSNFVHLCG